MRSYCAPSAQVQIAPGALPAALPDWLAARGLISTGTGWARFCRRLRDVPQHPVATTPTIRQVDAASAASFGDIVAAGFGMPAAFGPWFANIAGRPSFEAYLAYNAGQPVAGAAMYVAGEWAWLGFAATLPEFRGRGAQSALLARRISDGIERGVTGFTTETGAPPAGEEHKHPSYRNISRAGFEVAYVRQNFRQHPRGATG
jgi:GNAT superfamily N-acetyltransferase